MKEDKKSNDRIREVMGYLIKTSKLITDKSNKNKDQVSRLMKENSQIKEINKQLTETIQKLNETIERQKAEIVEITNQVVHYRKEYSNLEQYLYMDGFEIKRKLF